MYIYYIRICNTLIYIIIIHLIPAAHSLKTNIYTILMSVYIYNILLKTIYALI